MRDKKDFTTVFISKSLLRKLNKLKYENGYPNLSDTIEALLNEAYGKPTG
ncbi:hypothetical protein M0R04_14555 [Candidatus Dojkabacteria bacterium]|jgi:hypothetical protein|nr:hypothetical protein [Candidatus Dojkabacteria bacterium]